MSARLGSRWQRVALLAGVVSVLLAGGVASAASTATTVTVDCSLGGDLQAAMDANTTDTTIVIKGTCRGNFVFQTIGRGALTLLGKTGAVLDGQGTGAVLTVNALDPNATGTLSLQNLRVTNGRPGIALSSLSAAYPLSLQGVIVSGNQQDTRGAAGIDVIHATVNLESSSVSGNDGSNGGSGIMMLDGALFVRDSIISKNAGSGIDADRTCTVLQRVAITKNRTNGRGGGIVSSQSFCALQLTDSIVAGNTAALGGGIYGDRISLIRSAVLGNTTTNDGGGIYSIGDALASPSLTIVGSAVGLNTAAGKGGGIFELGHTTASAQDSTISGNRASYGGGVYNDGAFASLALQTGTSIIKNTATIAGGGIFNNGGLVSIAGGVPIALNKPDNCTGVAC